MDSFKIDRLSDGTVKVVVIRTKEGQTRGWIEVAFDAGGLVGIVTCFNGAISICLILVVLLLSYYQTHRRVTEQRILIIPDIGLQLETIRNPGTIDREFFPLEIVHGIVLYEAVTVFKVVLQLSLMVANREKMVNLFSAFELTQCQLKEILFVTRPLLNYE